MSMNSFKIQHAEPLSLKIAPEKLYDHGCALKKPNRQPSQKKGRKKEK